MLFPAFAAGSEVVGVFARKAGGWIVGWGMVPRGEVVVIMLILTTLVTPPVLIWLLKRQP